MKTKIALNSLIGAVHNLAHQQLNKNKDAIAYWDQEVTKYRIEVEKSFEALEAERDEADRRAGASERRQEELQDSANKRSQWLSQAKREAGYDDNVSFDVVWSETLALANELKN